jgi:hypothetical protein
LTAIGTWAAMWECTASVTTALISEAPDII